MKKINGKRLMALALAGIMSISMLTGCGGDTKQASGVEFDKNLIYKANYYTKPEELSYIGNVQTGMDGKIYAQGYSNTEGKDVTVQINPDNGQVEATYPSAETNGNTWVMDFVVDKDGNFWKLMSTYTMDEKNPENSTNTYNLSQTDQSGKEILNVELAIEDSNFYPSQMLIDQDGNLFLSASTGVIGYNQEGKEIFKVETKTYIDNMVIDGKGTIYAVSYSEDYNHRIISRIDKEAKELVQAQELDAVGMMNLVTGKDGLYLNDGIFMYSYNVETNEKTKIVNWINSDVNGSATYEIAGLPDGKFVGNVYDELTQQNQIMVVEKVQPEDVKDKKLVSLAMPYNDYNVNIAVIAFNKTNDEYRIVIEDYSQYATAENYNAGADKMNTDMISGKMSDLIAVGNLPIGNYSSKGLLADIYALMDNDSEFNRADYMENIFKAYEQDGKLYSIVPGFNVQTVLAKEKNVGKTMGWTMEDMEKAMEKMPEGAKIFENEIQSSILSMGLFLDADQYIDYTAGTCSFDGEEFIKLLNFAKQFPKEYEEGGVMGGGVAYTEAATGMISNNEDSAYAQNKVLLERCYLYNYSQIHDEKYSNFGGEELTFIGFPTTDKQGSAVSSSVEIAMSSKATYPEGAWAFLKYLLGDEYQEARSYEWPVKKSAYVKLKEEAQKPDTYIDENGKEQVYENTAIVNGKEVKIGKVTDEEIAKVDELLGSLNQVMRYDTKVQTIVEEESSAFFSDQKSADETAKLIQNRVQTYLSESK